MSILHKLLLSIVDSVNTCSDRRVSYFLMNEIGLKKLKPRKLYFFHLHRLVHVSNTHLVQAPPPPPPKKKKKKKKEKKRKKILGKIC